MFLKEKSNESIQKVRQSTTSDDFSSGELKWN